MQCHVQLGALCLPSQVSFRGHAEQAGQDAQGPEEMSHAWAGEQSPR